MTGSTADPKTARNVILVTTAMLSFISFWRAGAIVLCDIASTVYYIGGIAEHAIGKAGPWFILAVMLFSYAVRSLYIVCADKVLFHAKVVQWLQYIAEFDFLTTEICRSNCKGFWKPSTERPKKSLHWKYLSHEIFIKRRRQIALSVGNDI